MRRHSKCEATFIFTVSRKCIHYSVLIKFPKVRDMARNIYISFPQWNLFWTWTSIFHKKYLTIEPSYRFHTHTWNSYMYERYEETYSSPTSRHCWPLYLNDSLNRIIFRRRLEYVRRQVSTLLLPLFCPSFNFYRG